MANAITLLPYIPSTDVDGQPMALKIIDPNFVKEVYVSNESQSGQVSIPDSPAIDDTGLAPYKQVEIVSPGAMDISGVDIEFGVVIK